jgi:hypothetical protein
LLGPRKLQRPAGHPKHVLNNRRLIEIALSRRRRGTDPRKVQRSTGYPKRVLDRLRKRNRIKRVLDRNRLRIKRVQQPRLSPIPLWLILRYHLLFNRHISDDPRLDPV